MNNPVSTDTVSFQTKIDLLKTEYFKLQDFYESFDSKAQTIKGWSTTVSLAAITLGFTGKSAYIWLLAALSALVIWVIEAKWKQFQYCYADRIVEIEEAFQQNNFDAIQPLQIYSSWFVAWEKDEYSIFELMFMKIVMMPYVYAIIICITLFVLHLVFPGLFWTA